MQRVGARGLGQVGVHAGVAAGDRRQLREALEQLGVLVQHRAIARPPHPHHAAQLAVPAHRDGQGGPDVREGGADGGRGIAHVVVGEDGPSQLKRAPRDPSRLLDGAGAALMRDAGRLQHERCAGTAPEDEHTVRAEDAGGLLADPRQHARQVQALVEGLGRAPYRGLPRPLGAVLLGQHELRETGAGGLGQRGSGLKLGRLERARALVGDQKHVGHRAARMDHGRHQRRLRARLQPAGKSQLARLGRAQARRHAGHEHLGQRRGLVQAEPVVVRGLGIARDHDGTRAALVDDEHERGGDLEVLARLAHQCSGQSVGTLRFRGCGQQARNGVDRLSTAHHRRVVR